MSGVSIKYKGAFVASMEESGRKTLKTSGKYCEADVVVEYEKPQGRGIIEPLTVTENGTYTAPEGVDGYSPVVVNVSPQVPTGTVVVTAPTGSTVTMTKGTDVRTATEEGGTWTFDNLDFGSWTIAATKGTQAASKIITVDSTAVQSIEIVYQVKNTTYLYYLGDENEDAGGIDLTYGKNTGTTASKNENNVSFYLTNGTYGGAVMLCTHNAVDLIGYSAIYTFVKYTTITASSSQGIMYANGVNPKIDGTSGWIPLGDPTWAGERDGYNGLASAIPENTLMFQKTAITTSTNGKIACSSTSGGTGVVLAGNYYGLVITKTDDITGLSDYGSTIEAILANSDTLLANESAVDYMLSQCTGDFMWSAVASQSFKIALGNSAYLGRILANEEWAKALNLVGYYGKDLVPKMTSNTSPYGTVTYSTEYSPYYAYKAFNTSESQGWIPASTDSYNNAFVQYHAVEKAVLTGIDVYEYSLSEANEAYFKLQGSNDGANWDTLGENIYMPKVMEHYKYPIANEVAYEYFKIIVTGGTRLRNGNGYKFQVYGYEVE